MTRITLRILLSKNYRVNKDNSEILNLLNQYLVDSSLSKIAYFTNYIPTKWEDERLAAYFSYICLCASSLSEQSSFLYNKYWVKFRCVPFDVFISPVEERMTARQYNFISLKYKNLEDAIKALSFVKGNKLSINKNYPILLRLIVETDDICNSIDKNDLNIKCILSPSDVIVRIDE